VCWCAGHEPPKFPFLTVLSAEISFYADDMPLLELASALEGAFPGRIAIPTARLHDRVSLAYDKILCADVLGNIGLIVLDDPVNPKSSLSKT
jgi:hypothetical protein